MGTATLRKNERISSKLRIQNIFEKGEKVFSYPFFFAYQILPSPDFEFQIMIGVSKKKHKRAVDRNKIKRLCREVYRLHKVDFAEKCKDMPPFTLYLSLSFIGTQIPSFYTIQLQYLRAQQNLFNEISKNIGKAL